MWYMSVSCPYCLCVIPFTILISVQFRIRQWWMYVHRFFFFCDCKICIESQSNVVYIELHANILLMLHCDQHIYVCVFFFLRCRFHFIYTFVRRHMIFFLLRCSQSYNKIRYLLHLALTRRSIPVSVVHFFTENDTLIAWALSIKW